jgi:hypothetical protein
MTDELESKTFGLVSGEVFELDEATKLINHEVVHSIDHKLLPMPPHDKVGFIVGVLWVNEEIELIIKIDKKLAQVNKEEFAEHFLIVPEPS